MSHTEEIRKFIRLLESVYDEHLSTTFEWFNPDKNYDGDDYTKIYNVEADVNYGRTASASLSGNPDLYDLGEDDSVENVVVTDEAGNEIDQDELSGNGSTDWKVYKISDLAIQAIYRKMEEEGHGPYDFKPTPVMFADE